MFVGELSHLRSSLVMVTLALRTRMDGGPVGLMRGQPRSGVLFGNRGSPYMMTGTHEGRSAIMVCYSLEC